VPVRVRSCYSCLTSIVVMRQPSKLMSGVQFPSEAPCAASSVVEQKTLNLLVRGSNPWWRTQIMFEVGVKSACC
jgi:hypothetical protein